MTVTGNAGFVIVIDTREQRPYWFGPQIKIERRGLATGDYSVAGLEDRVAIERKTLEDAYGTIGARRDRFVRELERMSEMIRAGGFAAIVIESTLRRFFERPPKQSKVHPRAAVGSLISWQVAYGVHVAFCGSRDYGCAVTRKMLEKAWEKKRSVGI